MPDISMAKIELTDAEMEAALAERLKERGIATGVHYPRGLHQQPIFIELYGQCERPATEAIARNILALPVHHGLTEDDVRTIADSVCE